MGQTFDYREDTIGSTLVDLYPNGYNGLTQELDVVQFNAANNAITHDPFNLGTFVTRILGGITGGTFNLEFYNTGCNKELGCCSLPLQTQLRMKFADSVTTPFFSIYRHPKNMEITSTIFRR